MSISPNIYKQILTKYDKKRLRAEQDLEDRKKAVYEVLPRIKEIDDTMFNTGIKIAKAILADPSSHASIVASAQKNNKLDESEKLSILKEAGFTKDYLLPKYECKKCQDTGFINNKPCICFEQELTQAAYNQSNIKSVLSEENFDNFDFNFYSNEKFPEQRISSLENIKQIYQIANDFIHNFDKQFVNLLFYGTPGTGKTFLCNCIAKDMLDRGRSVLYLTAFELCKLFEDDRFKKRDDDEEERVNYLDSIFKVDLLIIDDLGTEFHTTLSSAELFNCINTRLLNKKSTVISTNLTLENLQKTYSARIASRILGGYKLLEFFGRDIRQTKKRLRK